MAHDHYYLDSTAEGKNGISADLLYLGSVRDDPNWFNIDHAHDFCEVLYLSLIHIYLPKQSRCRFFPEFHAVLCKTLQTHRF